jgi:hypothetical protein
MSDDRQCRCGAEPRPDDQDRCMRGHMLPGNKGGLIVGHRSMAFWKAHEDVRREIRAAVVQDAGSTPEDAPVALQLAADGIAQAALVRDAAYLRLVEDGGPLTSAGRTRRAFEVWLRAMDRLERHLRMVGLRREPAPVGTIAEYIATAVDAQKRGANTGGEE